eukprot:Gregarina_sp_Poly_1__4859@NODE_2588_length_1940_cov_120_170849_g1642_i0_p1_GENE_NODE_2588_length_1940_cov_120_170849_g1642_i0NODE_2588_length_1940_cov_120_170849_g1642_i0_p1_ORF_typecomplete_len472_score46_91_NODE_2588_length_1940_cov_120_170849_g1642_i04251840
MSPFFSEDGVMLRRHKQLCWDLCTTGVQQRFDTFQDDLCVSVRDASCSSYGISFWCSQRVCLPLLRPSVTGCPAPHSGALEGTSSRYHRKNQLNKGHRKPQKSSRRQGKPPSMCSLLVPPKIDHGVVTQDDSMTSSNAIGAMGKTHARALHSSREVQSVIEAADLKNESPLSVGADSEQALLWRAPLSGANKEALLILLAYCHSIGIASNGLLGLTLHENRTTNYAALTLNCHDPANPVVLTHYPDTEACKAFVQLSRHGHWISYNDSYPGLAPDVLHELSLGYLPSREEMAWPSNWMPFCCPEVQKRDCRRLQNDRLFTALFSAEGHLPEIVFEVKKYPLRGPQLVKKYYRVINDAVVEVDNHRMFHHKLHTFRNYICHKHQHIFAVDLYQVSQVPGNNFHHMRLIPFTNYNHPFLVRFLQRVIPLAMTLTHPLFQCDECDRPFSIVGHDDKSDISSETTAGEEDEEGYE